MAKINVYGTESYSTFICREPIEIDTDNYPELKGMTEDEMKEYIRSNAYEMKPVDGEYYENLEEELLAMDISHDKIYGEEVGIIFEGE
jgi:hypothetical protein